MVVTFCGHSQVANSEAVMEWLRAAAQELIEQGGTTFYLGGYGEFDNLAASVLREIKKLYPQIELILVLPYLNAPKDVWGYDGKAALNLRFEHSSKKENRFGVPSTRRTPQNH